jgi:hypothetical protein
VNREASSSAFAVELMTFTPRVTADNIINTPTWSFMFFSAPIGVYPFELDYRYSIRADFRALLFASPETVGVARTTGRLN